MWRTSAKRKGYESITDRFAAERRSWMKRRGACNVMDGDSESYGFEFSDLCHSFSLLDYINRSLSLGVHSSTQSLYFSRSYASRPYPTLINMGAIDMLLLLVTRPAEFRILLQYWLWHDQRDVSHPGDYANTGWDRETMRKCWGFLDLTSRSFAAVIKQLDGDLARIVCATALAKTLSVC